jgi:hypothetical protein
MGLPPYELPTRVLRGALVAASQSMIVLLDEDVTNLLSGENVAVLTKLQWPSSTPSGAPVAESHSLTALSQDADATVLPSGENAMSGTQFA